MKTTTNQPYWRFNKIEWPKFSKFLVVANLITVALPWAIYAFSIATLNGESGWGIFALYPLLTPLWYAGVVFAAVNVVTALVYLLTHKSNRNAILLSVATILLSIAYVSIFIH